MFWLKITDNENGGRESTDIVMVHWNKSMIQTQRNHREVYKDDPLLRNSILQWQKKFLETGNILNKTNLGCPCTSNVDVEYIWETFLQSLRKSVRSAARELNMPVLTVQKILRKRLRLYAYKV